MEYGQGRVLPVIGLWRHLQTTPPTAKHLATRLHSATTMWGQPLFLAQHIICANLLSNCQCRWPVFHSPTATVLMYTVLYAQYIHQIHIKCMHVFTRRFYILFVHEVSILYTCDNKYTHRMLLLDFHGVCNDDGAFHAVLSRELSSNNVQATSK